MSAYRRPPGSKIRHGQASCADYGCRRAECLEARQARQKKNKYLLKSGRPGMVPSTRAAAHLRRFQAAGVSNNEAIALIGISRNTFYRSLRGEAITRVSERQVLSTPIPARVEVMAVTRTVNATGTHRRLRALVAMGWPMAELARRVDRYGLWTGRVLKRSQVTEATAVRVAALYDGLWNRRPEQQGVALADAEEARQEAVRQGWNGPLAWDDDTIDDPRSVPMVDAPEPSLADVGENAVARFLMGESVLLDQAARGEVTAHLMEWTDLTVEQIAVRLESTPAAVDRKWHRIKTKAREEGRPVPWRRVFEQSYRGPENTNQQEMEIAA